MRLRRRSLPPDWPPPAEELAAAHGPRATMTTRDEAKGFVGRISQLRAEPPPAEDFMGRLARQWTEALAKRYADGYTDGAETALRILLGETVDGAEPFAGPLTPEVEAWARQALERIRLERLVVPIHTKFPPS